MTGEKLNYLDASFLNSNDFKVCVNDSFVRELQGGNQKNAEMLKIFREFQFLQMK